MGTASLVGNLAILLSLGVAPGIAFAQGDTTKRPQMQDQGDAGGQPMQGDGGSATGRDRGMTTGQGAASLFMTSRVACAISSLRKN